MNKINSPPSLGSIESVVNRAKAKKTLMAYDSLNLVIEFEKKLIDYPKPIFLSENDELVVIDDYFRKFREMLSLGQLLYGLTKKVETYYRKEDPAIKQEAIDRLEKIFTFLWTDITFISQLKDRILVKKEIELARKAFYIAIIALAIASVSLIFQLLLKF